jgi:hypothetical protein
MLFASFPRFALRRETQAGLLYASKISHRGLNMKKIATALAGASLLVLGACGGSEEATVDNSADTLNVAVDDLTLPDNSLDSVDANAAGDAANASANAASDSANAASDAANTATNATNSQ